VFHCSQVGIIAAGRSRSCSYSRSRSPRPRGRARSRYISVFLKQYSTIMPCAVMLIKKCHPYIVGLTPLPREGGMTTLLPQGQRKSTEGHLGRLKNTMGIRSGDHIPLMAEVIGVVQLMVMKSKLYFCFCCWYLYRKDCVIVGSLLAPLRQQDS
jgi:hypothetical protein